MYSDQRVKDQDNQGLNFSEYSHAVSMYRHPPPTPPTHTLSQFWVLIIKQVLHDDGNKSSLLQCVWLKNVVCFIA